METNLTIIGMIKMETVLIIIGVVAGISYLLYIVIWKETGISRTKELVKIMERNGFTKQIVAYDFLSEHDKKWGQTGFIHIFYVGIWVNYDKQKVVLRIEKDVWKVTVLRFSKIQSVELIEDGYSKITGAAIGYGGIAVGSAKVTEIIEGLYVKIVAGDIRTGAETYYLKLYEQSFSSKFDKSSSIYKSIEVCARAIVDEIKIIIHNSESTKPKNSEGDMKQCPYCSEEILATAKKCKHCGEWFEGK